MQWETQWWLTREVSWFFRRKYFCSFVGKQQEGGEKKTRTTRKSDSILLIESGFGLENIHCWCRINLSMDLFCREVAWFYYHQHKEIQWKIFKHALHLDQIFPYFILYFTTSWVKGKIVNFLAFVSLLKVNSTTTSHILKRFY